MQTNKFNSCIQKAKSLVRFESSTDNLWLFISGISRIRIFFGFSSCSASTGSPLIPTIPSHPSCTNHLYNSQIDCSTQQPSNKKNKNTKIAVFLPFLFGPEFLPPVPQWSCIFLPAPAFLLVAVPILPAWDSGDACESPRSNIPISAGWMFHVDTSRGHYITKPNHALFCAGKSLKFTIHLFASSFIPLQMGGINPPRKLMVGRCWKMLEDEISSWDGYFQRLFLYGKFIYISSRTSHWHLQETFVALHAFSPPPPWLLVGDLPLALVVCHGFEISRVPSKYLAGNSRSIGKLP